MSPMSWYSGSHDTPDCPSPGGTYESMAATFERTFAWVSATGFGSTVVPEENWTSVRSPGRGCLRSSPARGNSATARHPSAGRACATDWPRSLPILRSVSTRRAPLTSIIRAVRRWNSSRRPSRTGG